MDSHSDAAVWTLWQEQAAEEPMPPRDDIRAKAERLDARTRRWRMVTVPLLIALVIAEAWQVWIGNELLERAGDLLTIVALLYVMYRFRRHHMAAPPVALGSMNCAEFYRAELVHQRDLSRDGWGYLLPFVPGVALALLGGGFENRPTSQRVALVAFGVALFLGTAWWNAHTARKLQHEIDALDG